VLQDTINKQLKGLKGASRKNKKDTAGKVLAAQYLKKEEKNE
jgi:hypothetical protein